MWMCKAVLPGGQVCETSNFDSNEQCSNCSAPRQANPPDFESNDSGLDAHAISGKLLAGVQSAAQVGKERAKVLAPAAGELAKQARAKASEVALHSRLATRTGVHPLTVIAFCAILLIVSISLPVALSWQFQLLISNRTDMHESSEGYRPDQRLLGALSQSEHIYHGIEYTAVFLPRELDGPRKTPMLIASLLSGPILITGSPVVLTGQGIDESGGSVKGHAQLSLEHRYIFWASAIVLVLLLLVTDLLVGDIYAMQKLLITLIVVWSLYCIMIGMAAQFVIKDVAAELFPQHLELGLTPSGLLTAPLKLGALGLIYWMTSMLWRNIRMSQLSDREARIAGNQHGSTSTRTSTSDSEGVTGRG